MWGVTGAICRKVVQAGVYGLHYPLNTVPTRWRRFSRHENTRAKEPGFYLELVTPVCAEGGDYPGLNGPQRGVRRVQLVLDAAGYARLRPHLGKHVMLRGTLFAAHTGHHHAPRLLEVSSPVHRAPILASSAPAR